MREGWASCAALRLPFGIRDARVCVQAQMRATRCALRRALDDASRCSRTCSMWLQGLYFSAGFGCGLSLRSERFLSYVSVAHHAASHIFACGCGAECLRCLHDRSISDESTEKPDLEQAGVHEAPCRPYQPQGQHSTTSQGACLLCAGKAAA